MFPLFPPGSPPAPAAPKSETRDLGKVWSEDSAWYWSFMKLKTGPLGQVGNPSLRPPPASLEAEVSKVPGLAFLPRLPGCQGILDPVALAPPEPQHPGGARVSWSRAFPQGRRLGAQAGGAPSLGPASFPHRHLPSTGPRQPLRVTRSESRSSQPQGRAQSGLPGGTHSHFHVAAAGPGSESPGWADGRRGASP